MRPPVERPIPVAATHGLATAPRIASELAFFHEVVGGFGLGNRTLIVQAPIGQKPFAVAAAPTEGSVVIHPFSRKTHKLTGAGQELKLTRQCVACGLT